MLRMRRMVSSLVLKELRKEETEAEEAVLPLARLVVAALKCLSPYLLCTTHSALWPTIYPRKVAMKHQKMRMKFFDAFNHRFLNFYPMYQLSHNYYQRISDFLFLWEAYGGRKWRFVFARRPL